MLKFSRSRSSSMLEDSVKKRFVSKFVISILSSALNFGLMLFFPKFLGPAQYGQYEFAVNNFTILIGAMTLSVPDAYFNWIARKAKDLKVGEITASTLAFLFLIFLSVSLFILATHSLGYFSSIWPEISLSVAFYGLLIAFGLQLFNVFSILADGLGLTAKFEFFRLGQNTMRFIFTGLLCFLGWITLHEALFAYLLAIFISCLLALIWFNKKKILRGEDFKAHRWERDHLKTYSLFTFDYIRPLVIYSGLSFAFSFFDIWFLQYIDGSVQQSYLGISTRLAGMAGLITLAIQPILVREFAVAFEHQNEQRMKVLFDRVRLFYFISFFIGTVLFYNADLVLTLIGGKEYEMAVIVFKVLAFYPALQTLGRLHGAIYYSTARTKIYSAVGVVVMPLGILLSCYLIGHENSFISGLNLGAKGIAYKMILIDTLSIVILLFYNAAFIKVSFTKQLLGLVIVSLLQMGLFFGVQTFFKMFTLNFHSIFGWTHSNDVFTALLQIILFFVLLVFIVLAVPSLVGFSRHDLMSHLRLRKK